MAEVPTGTLACVVTAYNDPVHLLRLVRALDPFPIFLHVDARTPQRVFDEMTTDLPDRVTVLRRRKTPWASWGCVSAELDGYRQALESTDASHLALVSGSDYPLLSSDGIARYLGARLGRSIGWSERLPKDGWGHGGGYWRLRYRFLAWRKHALAWPIPRRLPRGMVFAGGSPWKILARGHAEALVRVADQRPDLVRRWRTTWIPEESFVFSVLHTPGLVPGWADEYLRSDPWVVRWSDGPAKSPEFITTADLGQLRRRRDEPSERGPAVFARKFSSAVDTAVLDAIDSSFRGVPSGRVTTS
jgi:hypothetical protein